jgi:hypothetical protein
MPLGSFSRVACLRRSRGHRRPICNFASRTLEEVHEYYDATAESSIGDRLSFWAMSLTRRWRPSLGMAPDRSARFFVARDRRPPATRTTGSLRSRSSSVLSASSYSCNVGGPLAAVFRAGTVGWIGLVVVAQNLSSFSHLFDFTQCVDLRIWGWHRRRCAEGVFIVEPIPRVADHDRGGIR